MFADWQCVELAHFQQPSQRFYSFSKITAVGLCGEEHNNVDPSSRRANKHKDRNKREKKRERERERERERVCVCGAL